MEMEKATTQHSKELDSKMYIKLAIMTVLSFIAMYVLMYAMVDVFANVVPNINQIYMAGLMTMPMVIIEIIVMRSMYMKKKINIVILISSSVALIVFFSASGNKLRWAMSNF